MFKLLLLISTLIGLSFFVFDYTRQSTSYILFLDKHTTANFLYQDSDGYISSMSILDIIARQCHNHKEYAQVAKDSALSFSEDQKIRLEECILEAEKFLKKLIHPLIKQDLLNTFSWKIAYADNKYEAGLPHTREDIIFLSTDSMTLPKNQLTKLLIHEYIHIYQRKNKFQFQKDLIHNGYIPWKKRSTYPRIRANPDLDDYIYFHPDGSLMLLIYTSDKPKHINDIVQPNHNYEHPNEEIAYEIANKYL